jgi:hypothetical protein
MNARVHTTVRKGLVAGITALLLAGCSDVPTGSGGLEPGEPRMLINGSVVFDRTAVAAIMVYQPTYPRSPGWRSLRHPDPR